MGRWEDEIYRVVGVGLRLSLWNRTEAEAGLILECCAVTVCTNVQDVGDMYACILYGSSRYYFVLI